MAAAAEVAAVVEVEAEVAVAEAAVVEAEVVVAEVAVAARSRGT